MAKYLWHGCLLFLMLFLCQHAVANPIHEHAHGHSASHEHAVKPSQKMRLERNIAHAVKQKKWEQASKALNQWLAHLNTLPKTQAQHAKKGMIFMGIALKSPEFTRILIQAGADVNATGMGFFKDTPVLHIAIQEGYTDIAKLLIQYGAKLNTKDRHKKTAVNYATEQENKKILDYIRKQQNHATTRSGPKSP